MWKTCGSIWMNWRKISDNNKKFILVIFRIISFSQSANSAMTGSQAGVKQAVRLRVDAYHLDVAGCAAGASGSSACGRLTDVW